MTFASTSKQVAVAMLGLAIAGLGGFFLWHLMQPTVPATVPDRHLVYLFAGMIGGGLLMFAPDILLGIGQKLMALFLEYRNGKVQPAIIALLFLGAAHASPLLPDAKLSPGAVRVVTLKEVCTPGSSKAVRNVPESEKIAVFAEYGIPYFRGKMGNWEVDHIISLELGGSNDIRNLWPQSFITMPYNAHVKDKLENRLHAEICAGTITMARAQMEISHNWIAAYKTRFEK